MSKATKTDELTQSGEMMINFHQVQDLIPDEQELLTIKPSTKVKDALKLMKEHHYSQLPVVVGRAVLGVFSYRSFGEKALTRQKANGNKWLGELPVDDFIEEYKFIHDSQDWSQIKDYLNRDDALFVGAPDDLKGLVTKADVLDYFHKEANPFIILAEIELSLRNVIENFIPQENWHEALGNSLKTAYADDAIPMALEDMSFDNYVQIITNGGNWSYFEAIFHAGDDARKQTTRKLQQLRDWRNVVFHHRGPLEGWKLETLDEHRAWLQRSIRAFEAKRDENASLQAAEPPKRGKLTREQLLENINPAGKELYTALLEEAQKRATRFVVGWHPTSFSIRLLQEGKAKGFLYGYVSDGLQIYFDYLTLPPDELARLRNELLAYGVFQDSGKHTLKAQPSETNIDTLFKASVFMMNSLERWVEGET